MIIEQVKSINNYEGSFYFISPGQYNTVYCKLKNIADGSCFSVTYEPNNCRRTKREASIRSFFINRIRIYLDKLPHYYDIKGIWYVNLISPNVSSINSLDGTVACVIECQLLIPGTGELNKLAYMLIPTEIECDLFNIGNL